MAQLSKKEVQHIAHLARLGVAEEDLEFYAEELSAVLGYVEQLNDLDVSDTAPTNHAIGLYSVFREDERYDMTEKERGRRATTLQKALPAVQDGFAKVKAVFNRNAEE